MKSLDFLVVRCKGEVIDFYRIEDGYTSVVLNISKDSVDEETFKLLPENGYLGETEAMQHCGTYGDLSIAIENVECISI